jgi:UV DNA damage endonuclease
MKLGLCCISISLQQKGHKFQKMTYSRFKALPRQEALTTLSDRIRNNLRVTNEVMRFCVRNNISSYRMSSDLLPVINHPDVNIKLQDLPNSLDIFNEASRIKKTICQTGLKVTAHPSEYISLTSDNDRVIQNSITDLKAHADLFDLVGLPRSYDAPLNIHCRKDGEPEEISSKFMANFKKLPHSVKSRLVLEVNDNKKGMWSVKNLCKFFNQRHSIPITFDNLHHSFCNHDTPEEEAFSMAYDTWKQHNATPVFHYSEGVNNTRKHAEYATGLPNSYGKDVFWEVELKGKDLAIFKMMK